MNLKYEREYTITTNLLDKNDYLKPSSILDLCQHIAGEHADMLDCGFDPFIKKGYIWVVVRNFIEIVKQIKNLKKVRLVTYALNPQFVEMPRDVEIYSGDTLLYKVRMVWVIIDIKNNTIVNPKEAPNFFIEGKGLFERRIKKLPTIDFNLLEFYRNQDITYSMLDHNGHMNNTRYLEIFLDKFKDNNGKYFLTYQVEYLKQCFENECLTTYSYEVENEKYLIGYKDNEIRFIIKGTY